MGLVCHWAPWTLHWLAYGRLPLWFSRDLPPLPDDSFVPVTLVRCADRALLDSSRIVLGIRSLGHAPHAALQQVTVDFLLSTVPSSIRFAVH